MSALDHTLAYARQYIPRFLDELRGLCAIPSISSLPEYKTERQRSVEYVGGLLRTAVWENVQILPTEGHPVVVGEWLNAGQNRPTVLFYGHYDVQPALDLDAWHSHPFHPEVRGENLYGRGASDMKGQVMAEMAAVQAWIEAGGGLPVNVKF